MAYLPGLKDSIRVAFLKILLATFVWLFTNLPEILVVSSIKNVSLIPTLCDSMDCSLLASSVYGILQARVLECVAMLSSRGLSPNPGIEPEFLKSPALAGMFF